MNVRTEVLCSLGYEIVVKLEDNAASRLVADGHIEEHKGTLRGHGG